MNNYYPFGMVMPGRTYSAAGSYRYGFNGKENDNEVKGEGNQQDYGMRIYDPRLGKFLSVDPLTKNYPMLTPYQFASNRPNDGVDLDGLEYLTVHIYFAKDQNGDLFIKRKTYTDHRNMTAEQIQAAHGMSAKEFYRRFSQSFGAEGRGIKWVYHREDGTVMEPRWEMKQDGDLSGVIPSESEMEFHGIYSGGGCITVEGPMFKHQGVNTIGLAEKNSYDFAHRPIDMPDYISKVHDMMQDGIVDYQGWLEDTRTLESDEWLYKEAGIYQKTEILNTYKDPYTGRKSSSEARFRAGGIRGLFNAAIQYKKFKNAALKEMGYDPNDAQNQQHVTLDDWKPKWYQFAQKKNKAILKASGGGKTKEQMAEYWKPKK